MTKNLRTSPLLKYHFDNFIEQNGGEYDSDKFAWKTGEKQPRFGLFWDGADDGIGTSFLNMPRQFVGSFNIKITEKMDDVGNYTGDVRVVIHNPTSWGSFAAESVFTSFGVKQPEFFQSFEREKWSNKYLGTRSQPKTPFGTINQYFYWEEKNIIKRETNDVRRNLPF